MPKFSIVIKNLIVNEIFQNGNIDIGQNVQNSHTANSKTFGSCFTIGDFSNAFQVSNNCIKDINKLDQSSIELPK